MARCQRQQAQLRGDEEAQHAALACSSDEDPLLSASAISDVEVTVQATTSRPATSARHQTIASRTALAVLFVCTLLATLSPPVDACSTRSTPKPRGLNPFRRQQFSLYKPNVSFQTYACPPAYAAWYCLNGAACFTVKLSDSIQYNCECVQGYAGQRCEFRSSEVPLLAQAPERLVALVESDVIRATLAALFVVASIFAIGLSYSRRRSDARMAAIADSMYSKATSIQIISDEAADAEFQLRPSTAVDQTFNCSQSGSKTLTHAGQPAFHLAGTKHVPFRQSSDELNDSGFGFDTPPPTPNHECVATISSGPVYSISGQMKHFSDCPLPSTSPMFVQPLSSSTPVTSLAFSYPMTQTGPSYAV